MASWVMRMLSAGGYAAIVFLMFVENLFPPIPSELILPLAGYMVRTKDLAFVGVVLAGTFGSVLGAVPFYLAGRRLGIKRIKHVVERHARWTTVSVKDIERAEAWFERHGAAAVFFCRLVPGIRSLISIPAGIRRMSPVTFILCTGAGSLAWSTVLVGAGYALAGSYERVNQYLDPVSWGIVGGLVVWYFVRVIRG